jgi:RNA polymerase sigma-70 factor (ECF subfamily)
MRALSCHLLPHRARTADVVSCARMADAFEAGRTAWPELELPAAVFGDYLAARALEPDASHGADLYLACACATGLPGALAAFEATYVPMLPSYLARLRPSAELLDEVAQILRERLFVGPKPKIADYAGKGELGGWLRVVAVRIAIDLRRASPPRMDDVDQRGSLAVAADGPELEALRHRYRGHFRAAFTASLRGLSSEQRALLKLHYLDALSMDELGRMFGVNRSTIFRRLGACSQALLDGIRDRLGAELGVSTQELHSLAAALRGDLEVSLGDYLKSSA